MWVHLILILKKSKFSNNHEQIKVQMNFKNIYIHEGRLFVCFVPMVHETYKYGLLAVHCCTSFAACFGTSIQTANVIDNDDPPMFYPSCNHRIKHHINQLWTLHCNVENHVHNQRIFFLCYFSLIFTFESLCHLSNEHNSSCSIFLQSSCKPLDMLLVQQISKLQNSKISSFVKELLLLFITASWEKTQINPTTYSTYGNKKKRTQTFLYSNYGSKRKTNPPWPPTILMTTPKNR